jgi:hypothetical protein
MVPRLQKVDLIIFDQMDDTVLFRETPRPCPWRHVLQRLGLSDAVERIAKYRFN